MFFGSLRSFLRRYGRGLPVRRRRDDQREQLLHIPAGLAELDRQPVEQFGMRRRLRLRAEVVGRLEQARRRTTPARTGSRSRARTAGSRDRRSIARARAGFAAAPGAMGGRNDGVRRVEQLARLIVHPAKQQRRRRLRIGPLFHHHRGVRAQFDLAMLGARRARTPPTATCMPHRDASGSRASARPSRATLSCAASFAAAAAIAGHEAARRASSSLMTRLKMRNSPIEPSSPFSPFAAAPIVIGAVFPTLSFSSGAMVESCAP